MFLKIFSSFLFIFSFSANAQTTLSVDEFSKKMTDKMMPLYKEGIIKEGLKQYDAGSRYIQIPQIKFFEETKLLNIDDKWKEYLNDKETITDDYLEDFLAKKRFSLHKKALHIYKAVVEPERIERRLGQLSMSLEYLFEENDNAIEEWSLTDYADVLSYIEEIYFIYWLSEYSLTNSYDQVHNIYLKTLPISQLVFFFLFFSTPREDFSWLNFAPLVIPYLFMGLAKVLGFSNGEMKEMMAEQLIL